MNRREFLMTGAAAVAAGCAAAFRELQPHRVSARINTRSKAGFFIFIIPSAQIGF